MSLPRGGLWPVRHQSGEASFQTQRVKKETGENDASLVYVGDAVRIVSGKAIRYTAGDVSGGVAPPVFGVVARVLRDEAGRPRVHGLPDQHPNISLTADADWLDVYTDKGIVFAARIAGSATNELLGSVLNVAATARVTAAGISGTMLNATAVSGDRGPFTVVGVSNFDLDGGASDAAGRCEVIMNYHALNTPADT